MQSFLAKDKYVNERKKVKVLSLQAFSELFSAVLHISFAEIQCKHFICESERSSFVPPVNSSKRSAGSKWTDMLMNSES